MFSRFVTAHMALKNQQITSHLIRSVEQVCLGVRDHKLDNLYLIFNILTDNILSHITYRISLLSALSHFDLLSYMSN